MKNEQNSLHPFICLSSQFRNGPRTRTIRVATRNLTLGDRLRLVKLKAFLNIEGTTKGGDEGSNGLLPFVHRLRTPPFTLCQPGLSSCGQEKLRTDDLALQRSVNHSKTKRDSWLNLSARIHRVQFTPA